MRLRQVAQRVEDLERAVAFYQGTLELPLIARFDPPGIAFFDLEGTRLMLAKTAASTILYLSVDGLDARVSALAAAGVHVEAEPALVFPDPDGTFGDKGEAEWMAFLKDSEGNLFALVARKAL